MLKYMLSVAIAGGIACGFAVAQEAIEPTESPRAEQVDRVLIADPEPVETEYFLAEGAASSEIVSDEELLIESDALAALTEEMDGDMAAMPETIEE